MPKTIVQYTKDEPVGMNYLSIGDIPTVFFNDLAKGDTLEVDERLLPMLREFGFEKLEEEE